MIEIETIHGYLITHKEYIHSLLFDRGRYMVIIIQGKRLQKWEITANSYHKIRSMLYGKEA